MLWFESFVNIHAKYIENDKIKCDARDLVVDQDIMGVNIFIYI